MFITEEKILKKIFQERTRGNIERARKQALKGHRKWPENFDISIELIQLCIETSDGHEAVKYMKSAVKNNPGRKNEIIQFASESFYQNSDPFLGSFIIESYIRNSDIDNVRNFLRRVSEKYIKGLIKRSQTKSEGFIQRDDTAGAAFTDNELLLGLLYMEDGRHREAVAPLGRALKNYPEQSEKIGSIMLELQREIPNCSELEFHLGMASVNLDHPGKAEHRFFNAICMENPPLEKILEVMDSRNIGENREMIRGEILLRLSREEEGVAEIRKYLSGEQDGWNEQSEDRIKQLFPAHADRKSTCYDRLLLLPEETRYLKDTVFLLCDICSDLNKYKEASEHLEKLAELSPGYSGDITGWIENRENILQTAPARKLLAVLNMREGEYQVARDHFSAAAEMDPELTPDLIRLINQRIDQEGKEVVLTKILVDLYTRTGESEKAHSLLQELKQEETLSGSEAMEMTTRVIESCGATVENIVSAVEFSAENDESGEIVPHLVEFCRANPEKQEKLAGELKKLASSDNKFFSLIAEILGEAGREAELSEPLKYLHAISLLNSGEIEKGVFAFDQLMMFNDGIKYDVMSEYERVVVDNYQNSTLLLALYQMNLDEEDYVRAAHYLGKFLESDPSQIKDVISRFDQIAGKVPMEAGIWKEMLESALSINHGNLAHQILERAVSTMGETEAAPLHIYGAMLYRENRNMEESLKCLAIALTSERSDLKAIEKELDGIISNSPDNAGALYLCGETCLRMGKEEKAAETFRECVKGSPQYTSRVRERLSRALPVSVKPWLINRLLGVISWEGGKPEEGLSFFARAQKGDLESLSALGEELKRCLDNAPDNTELRKLFADNLRLRKIYPQAVRQIELLLAARGYSQPEALSFLGLITGEERNQFEANRLMAKLLIEEGKTEESLEPAINMLNSPEAEPADMAKSAEELLAVHRENSGFIRRYGSVKLRMGMEEEAIGLLREAMDSDSSQYRKVLEDLQGHQWSRQFACEAGLLEADCLMEAGEYQKSYQSLKDIMDRFDPDPSDLLERIDQLIRNRPDSRYYSMALKLEASLHDFSAARQRIYGGSGQLEGDELTDLKIELAGLADMEGLSSEASGIYSEVLEESSDRNDIYRLIESSLAEMARTRLEKACSEESPDRIEADRASELIDTALDFGEYKLAGTILEKSLLPEGRRIYNLGRIYLATERPTMAVSLLSSCMNRSSLTPEERIEALYSLGTASEILFDFGRAASAFMKILEMKGEYRDASKRARVNYTRCLEEEDRIFTIEKTAALNELN
ncbi:MAG: tetratricopeptide repeat protein [Candidatus Latescibacteria bacterium]|nr:tetratricopeptide repeat protein [bacterium]MBD3423193.1 tetratricopeptide repeat protein [Candidatus Latescibacterota bacterium]